MEEEFVVKTMSEGGVVPTADIKQIMNTMGCLGFNTQATGSVKVVVEKNEGRITKDQAQILGTNLIIILIFVLKRTIELKRRTPKTFFTRLVGRTF